MHARQCLCPLRISPGQATQPTCPANTACPSCRQHEQALLGCGPLDDCQLPRMGLGLVRGLVPWRAWVHEGTAIARHVLDLRGPLCHPGPLRDVGGGPLGA